MIAQPIISTFPLLEPVHEIGQLTTTSIHKMAEIHCHMVQRYLDMNARRMLKATEIHDAQTLQNYLHHHLEMWGDFSLGILQDASRLTDLSVQLQNDISQMLGDSYSKLLRNEDAGPVTRASTSEAKPPETQDTQAAA